MSSKGCSSKRGLLWFFFFNFIYYGLVHFLGEEAHFCLNIPMISISLDNGVQNGRDSKNQHFMNSSVHGHPHEHIKFKYGLRFAWLGSLQIGFRF